MMHINKRKRSPNRRVISQMKKSRNILSNSKQEQRTTKKIRTKRKRKMNRKQTKKRNRKRETKQELISKKKRMGS